MHCLTECGMLTWEGHELWACTKTHLRAARLRQLPQRLRGGVQRTLEGLRSCQSTVRCLTEASNLT